MAKKPPELKRLQFYNWGDNDHDPMIDQCRTLAQDELGRGGKINYSKVAQITGQSPATVRNWFNRTRTATHKPTMRPQFSSVMNFVRAFGKDLRIVEPERRVSGSTGVLFTRNVRAKADLNLTQ
jgi:hypothetical protein